MLNVDLKHEDGIISAVPLDGGSIGPDVDTRLIARKGYQPSRATVVFSGDYSQYLDELKIILEFKFFLHCIVFINH